MTRLGRETKPRAARSLFHYPIPVRGDHGIHIHPANRADRGFKRARFAQTADCGIFVSLLGRSQARLPPRFGDAALLPDRGLFFRHGD